MGAPPQYHRYERIIERMQSAEGSAPGCWMTENQPELRSRLDLETGSGHLNRVRHQGEMGVTGGHARDDQSRGEYEDPPQVLGCNRRTTSAAVETVPRLAAAWPVVVEAGVHVSCAPRAELPESHRDHAVQSRASTMRIRQPTRISAAPVGRISAILVRQAVSGSSDMVNSDNLDSSAKKTLAAARERAGETRVSCPLRAAGSESSAVLFPNHHGKV